MSYTWLSLIASVLRISIVSARNRIWLGRTNEKCMQCLPSYEENIFYQQVYVTQIINQEWWENIGIFKQSEMYKICVLLTLPSKATWGNTLAEWEDTRERERWFRRSLKVGLQTKSSACFQWKGRNLWDKIIMTVKLRSPVISLIIRFPSCGFSYSRSTADWKQMILLLTYQKVSCNLTLHPDIYVIHLTSSHHADIVSSHIITKRVSTVQVHILRKTEITFAQFLLYNIAIIVQFY